jgi:hypothetical protein
MQYFLERYFNISSNTAATIIITLVVFITGQLIVYFSKQVKSIAQRRITRRTLQNIISASIRVARRQEKTNRKIGSQMNFESISSLVQSRSDFFQLRVLEEVGFDLVFRAYYLGIENTLRRRKKLDRTIYKCWEVITSMDFWIREHYKRIDFIGEKFNKHHNEFVMVLKQYRQYVIKVGRTYNQKNVPEYFHKSLSEFFDLNKSLSTISAQNVQVIKDEFIDPLHNLMKTLPDDNELKFHLDEFIHEFNFHFDGMERVLIKGKQQYFLYEVNSKYFYKALEVVSKRLLSLR